LQADHALPKTHWSKTLLLSEMWKEIYPITSPDQPHANTHGIKTTMLPVVRKTMFGCCLLCFSHDNTYCIENHFGVSGLEYSITVHVT